MKANLPRPSPSASPARLALLAALLGCDDAIKLNTGASGGDAIPSGQEGWCAVQSIFEAKCVSCHGAAALGGLDLAGDPYAAVVDQPSANYAGWTLVVPNDPQTSLLYRKAAGTQEAGLGTEMPPGAGLDAGSLAAIEAWINDGAPSTCDDPGAGGGTGGIDGHHPAGYADPAVHGEEAKWQDQECADCHGEDLKGSPDGSIPSCDTCHTPAEPAAWRTDCTFCHGGQDNATGAPPVQLFGQGGFFPHTAHVEESDKKVALACTQCHTKPTSVLSLGHVFLGDDTPGQAEVNFTAGLSPKAEWDGLECSNSYCHGNGRGDNGTIAHTAGEQGCSDCHATNGGGMSGRHGDHLEEGARCYDCHDDTVMTSGGSYAIQDKALHVNGRADTSFPSGMRFNDANNTCTGTCHLGDESEYHGGRSWTGDDD